MTDRPARTHAPPPSDYTGPYRAWGPPIDEIPQTGPGKHNWISEEAPTQNGPFTKVNAYALEWWNGKEWIGID